MKGDIFHILNRGVEKRKIFLDEDDYLRFVHNLEYFNCKGSVLMSYSDRCRFYNSDTQKTTDELVDILCWCIMPNHYHILVREKIDGGASIFSKKLSSGYTQSFNLKNKRSGVLFQWKSKIINIKHDEHFLHLPYYIFSNPIKLIDRNWKNEGIKDLNNIIKFLEDYKWSNFLNIISKDNFSNINNKKLFFDFFSTNEKQFKKDFRTWLSDSQVYMSYI